MRVSTVVLQVFSLINDNFLLFYLFFGLYPLYPESYTYLQIEPCQIRTQGNWLR